MRQQSRVVWIQHRDRNSKYFYADLKSRQARNKIKSNGNEQGRKVAEPHLVQEEFLAFLKILLGQAAETLPSIDINIVRDEPYLTLIQ